MNKKQIQRLVKESNDAYKRFQRVHGTELHVPGIQPNIRSSYFNVKNKELRHERVERYKNFVTMNKKHIRYTDNDLKRIEKTVMKFNKKIDSVKSEKSIRSIIAPSKISKNDLYDLRTRADLNKAINKYNRFLKDGSEDVFDNGKGLYITKWEKNEMNRTVNQINAQKKKRGYFDYREHVFVSEDEAIAEGKLEKPIDWNNISVDEFLFKRKIFNNLSNDTYYMDKDDVFFVNFANAIQTIWEDDAKTKIVYDLLNKMGKDYAVKIGVIDEILSFDFIYDSSIDGDNRLESLIERMELIMNDKEKYYRDKKDERTKFEISKMFKA